MAMKKAKLDKLITMVEDAKKKLQKDGAAAMKEMFSDFFKAHPEVRSIVWTQYTPYFNDGEPCVFGVNDLDLRVNREGVAEDAYNVYKSESDDDSDADDDNRAYCSFARALESIRDDKRNQDAVKRGWNKNKLRALTQQEEQLLSDFNDIKAAFASEAVSSICETVFGDHVLVAARPDGFETYSYEHD